MRTLARRCFLLPVFILIGVCLVLPVRGEAADDEVPPESEVASESYADKISISEIEELRKLLEKQELQLAAQQEEIEKQRTLLQSVQLQLDQFSVDRKVIPEQEDAEQPQRSTSIDELVATQPESTRYGEDFTGSIPIPDTEAAIKIGGFVKMSMVDSLDPLGSDDRFITGLIPVGAAGSTSDDGEVAVSARQSRLGIEIRDSTSYGPLRAFVEGDFAGNGNTYRLRHAFGQFRNVLAGKTWSTMVDNRATPEEVDFEGINGRIQVRQPQIRYFPSFGRNNLVISHQRHLAVDYHLLATRHVD
jgi:hypothetical protein